MNTIHDIILIIRQVFYLLIKIAFHPQLKKVIFSKKKNQNPLVKPIKSTSPTFG